MHCDNSNSDIVYYPSFLDFLKKNKAQEVKCATDASYIDLKQMHLIIKNKP